VISSHTSKAIRSDKYMGSERLFSSLAAAWQKGSHLLPRWMLLMAWRETTGTAKGLTVLRRD
jgi:hypothetical protein